MIRALRILLAAVIVPAVLLPPAPALAIANGEDVPDGGYEFSVLLTMTGLPDAGGGTRDSSCSGALIAPRWVITAGHCFRDIGGNRVDRAPARRTTATIGRADLDSDAGQVAEVAGVHQADGADVALVELASAVTGITPLTVGSAPPQPGEVVRLTGYGLRVDRPVTRMQTGRFTVGQVGDTTLQTSGRAPREDTSPCPHDSGGPYFRERPGQAPVLVAVVSTGPGCPHPGPDFAARTDNLTPWIDGVIGGSRTHLGVLAGGVTLLVLAALLVIRRAHRVR